MIGERKYSAHYGGSHPGDSGAFAVVIFVIVIFALAAYWTASGQ